MYYIIILKRPLYSIFNIENLFLLFKYVFLFITQYATNLNTYKSFEYLLVLYNLCNYTVSFNILMIPTYAIKRKQI